MFIFLNIILNRFKCGYWLFGLTDYHYVSCGVEYGSHHEEMEKLKMGTSYPDNLLDHSDVFV